MRALTRLAPALACAARWRACRQLPRPARAAQHNASQQAAHSAHSLPRRAGAAARLCAQQAAPLLPLPAKLPLPAAPPVHERARDVLARPDGPTRRPARRHQLGGRVAAHARQLQHHGTACTREKKEKEVSFFLWCYTRRRDAASSTTLGCAHWLQPVGRGRSTVKRASTRAADGRPADPAPAVIVIVCEGHRYGTEEDKLQSRTDSSGPHTGRRAAGRATHVLLPGNNPRRQNWLHTECMPPNTDTGTQPHSHTHTHRLAVAGAAAGALLRGRRGAARRAKAHAHPLPLPSLAHVPLSPAVTPLRARAAPLPLPLPAMPAHAAALEGTPRCSSLLNADAKSCAGQWRGGVGKGGGQ